MKQNTATTNNLGSCGPGKLTEKGKFPEVLRGGCKRSFGSREQGSPKSLLHHPKLLLHRCKMGFGWCKRLFGDLCSLGPKDLLHPPLSTFGNFPFSVNFPGPQLPKLLVTTNKETTPEAQNKLDNVHKMTFFPAETVFFLGGKCLQPTKTGKTNHEDVNGEKLTVKKWWLFGCRFFHGLRRVFHGL